MSFFVLPGLNRTLGSTVRLYKSQNLLRSHLTAGGRWCTRSMSSREVVHGAAGTWSRYRRTVLMTTAVVGTTAVALYQAQQAEMATRLKKKKEEKKEEDEGGIRERCEKFMSPPITELQVLEEKKNQMSSRMEMLIMETQAEFCRALEKVDGGKFKVDRWNREEGMVPL